MYYVYYQIAHLLPMALVQKTVHSKLGRLNVTHVEIAFKIDFCAPHWRLTH